MPSAGRESECETLTISAEPQQPEETTINLVESDYRWAVTDRQNRDDAVKIELESHSGEVPTWVYDDRQVNLVVSLPTTQADIHYNDVRVVVCESEMNEYAEWRVECRAPLQQVSHVIDNGGEK